MATNSSQLTYGQSPLHPSNFGLASTFTIPSVNSAPIPSASSFLTGSGTPKSTTGFSSSNSSALTFGKTAPASSMSGITLPTANSQPAVVNNFLASIGLGGQNSSASSASATLPPAPTGTNASATVSAQPNSVLDYLSSIGSNEDIGTVANIAVGLGLAKNAQAYIDQSNSGQAGDVNTKILAALQKGQGSSIGSSAGQSNTGSVNSGISSAVGSMPGSGTTSSSTTGASTAGSSTAGSSATSSGSSSTSVPGTYINDDGSVNVQGYLRDSTNAANAQLSNVQASNKSQYADQSNSLDTQWNQWQQQFAEQKEVALDAAKMTGNNDYVAQTDKLWQDQYDDMFQNYQQSKTQLGDQLVQANLGAQNDYLTAIEGAKSNAANISQGQQQFAETTANSALSNFRQLLSQTDVNYSDPNAVTNMSDSDIVANYGALVQLATKGGMSLTDATQEIRNGLFKQAQAAAATEISQENLQLTSERTEADIANIGSEIDQRDQYANARDQVAAAQSVLTAQGVKPGTQQWNIGLAQASAGGKQLPIAATQQLTAYQAMMSNMTEIASELVKVGQTEPLQNAMGGVLSEYIPGFTSMNAQDQSTITALVTQSLGNVARSEGLSGSNIRLGQEQLLLKSLGSAWNTSKVRNELINNVTQLASSQMGNLLSSYSGTGYDASSFVPALQQVNGAASAINSALTGGGGSTASGNSFTFN